MSIRSEEGDIRAFWSNVAKLGEDDCWVWTAGFHNGPGGYGTMYYRGKKIKAHRLSFLLAHGELPPDKMVCHHCDNPPCVNPKHLFLGTAKDNAQDCARKGRLHRERGSERYNAKLSEEQVARIKLEAPFRKYGWGRRLAKEFGVCPSAISNIVKGFRWKWFETPTT